MTRRTFLSNLALGVAALPVALIGAKKSKLKPKMLTEAERLRIFVDLLAEGRRGDATLAILHYNSGAPFPPNMGQVIS